MKAILFALALICSGLLNAATLTVNLDGSAQFTTIQSAINASANGDIVLVYPGRYFENVDFNGKQITLQSLEATTNDTTYISTTIIDGNNTGSCVRFHNAEQNATLRGFTLTHGIGFPVFAENQRMGGGIHIYAGCNVTILNCEIKDNKSATGAGVFMYKSSAAFGGVKIHHNYASTPGGGIYIVSISSYIPNIVFNPVNRCSIYENYGINPCDIVVTDVMQNIDFNLDMFSVANPDNFYIARYNNFAQTAPYSDHLYYQRTYRSEIDHDLYVSPTGNDTNTGLSAEQALKTITIAMHRVMSDSLYRNTVYVLPGTYSETEEQQIFPIPMKSNVNLVGAGSDQVTLYADFILPNIIPGVIGTAQQRNMLLSGFKITAANNGNRLPFAAGVITNSKFKDIIIDGVQVAKNGALYLSVLINTEFDGVVVRNIITQESCFNVAGYWVSGSMRNCIFDNIQSTFNNTLWDAITLFNVWVKDSLIVENCTFSNFSVYDDQNTFHISNTNGNSITPVHININNCLFDNIRTNSAYSIGLNNENVNEYQVSNCTFINNYGQMAAVGMIGKEELHNNILLNTPSTHEIYMDLTSPFGFHSELTFDYNNIRNGQSGISNPFTNNILTYGANNNSEDPRFASTNPLDDNYLYLTANSPCRDAGTPDTTGLSLPVMDLAGNYRIWNNRIDMGCYEYGAPSGNAEEIIPPEVGGTLSNYPNPFNPSTTISYQLPKDCKVNLAIYNVRGQMVKSLVNENKALGKHSVVWDGKDDAGSVCASGVYFYRLTAQDKTLTKKMLMLK